MAKARSLPGGFSRRRFLAVTSAAGAGLALGHQRYGFCCDDVSQQAARTLRPQPFAKPVAISLSPVYWRLGYRRSAIGTSRSSRTSNSPKRAEVPPISPAKIMCCYIRCYEPARLAAGKS